MQDEFTPIRWMSIEELAPGMVLARPVVSTQHRVLDFKLGAGTHLTDGMISQLSGRGVECVAVFDAHPLSPEEYDKLRAAHEERLLMIFRANSPEALPADRRPLYEALVKIGPHR